MVRPTGVTTEPSEDRERPDAELIAAWQAGDEAAAAALVRRHAAPVARFLSAAGAADELDDLVQETFYRAFRKLDSFRGGAQFRTWLLAIASNALRDARRRLRRRIVFAMADQDVADERQDPHAAAVEAELLQRVARAIEGLTRMQRDVFLMRVQLGADYEEIAAALGTTAGAARVHYHQAMKRIRASIGETDDG